MVKFKVRVSDKRLYLKDEIMDILNTNEAEIIANAKSFICYNPNEDLDLLLESVDVLRKDLKLRLEDKKRKDEKQ